MIAVERRERADRKHAAAEQQVGDGQRQQEVVGRRSQLPVGTDRDADEQVAADRDDDEHDQRQPDADRLRHAVARRAIAYVISGRVLVRRPLGDVERRSYDRHCAARDRTSNFLSASNKSTLYDEKFTITQSPQ